MHKIGKTSFFSEHGLGPESVESEKPRGRREGLGFGGEMGFGLATSNAETCFFFAFFARSRKLALGFRTRLHIYFRSLQCGVRTDLSSMHRTVGKTVRDEGHRLLQPTENK